MNNKLKGGWVVRYLCIVYCVLYIYRMILITKLADSFAGVYIVMLMNSSGDDECLSRQTLNIPYCESTPFEHNLRIFPRAHADLPPRMCTTRKKRKNMDGLRD